MWLDVCMRRPINITLDDEFVRQMDAARNGQSRGRWVEGLVEGGALMPHIPSREDEARMQREDRSPSLQPKIEEPREPLLKSARQLLEEQRQEEAGEG